ncbi:MAG: STM4011 family radical SAM protein [Pseudomonadales bacterium]|nr:STM4011 family radical SAM protein [Pseudomonadales bacterium]
MKLQILYRGPLASCNYACGYCPFAKREDDRAARTQDQQALERFVQWVENQAITDNIQILFTPWGEALVRRWYRDTVVKLSHLPQVTKVAVQTNLSVPPDWLAQANIQRTAIWATYHPGETPRKRFIAHIKKLSTMGVACSVGIVGKKEHRAAAEQLRNDLPEHLYLWVNAYKDEPAYYSEEDIRFFKAIDPLFEINLYDYASYGEACQSGYRSVTIDGEGDVRRCHFVSPVMGNIYQQDIREILNPAPCPKACCDCYIGYIFLDKLRLEEHYGDRLLERIPLAYGS